MKKKLLIHTEHYTDSIVEVYVDFTNNVIKQNKCLTGQKCSTYTYPIKTYIEKKFIGYKKIKINSVN
tara:strand:- start:4848 stop:5048 length:201 start_codon:yes stop_codon:yes gene_type:complete